MIADHKTTDLRTTDLYPNLADNLAKEWKLSMCDEQVHFGISISKSVRGRVDHLFRAIEG